MSSLRNAVQRRNHKERAQPLERQKLGLLEKHKDYSLRAKDWNKKKATLKSLRQKAADRNEDEFYFGMLSRKGPGSALTRGKKSFTGTVEGDRGNKALDVDTVRLLKTQDIGYLRTMRNVAAKEVAELEQKAILAGAMRKGADDDEEEDDDDEEPAQRKKAKKIVFSDNAEDQSRALPELESGEEDDDDMDIDNESQDGEDAEADANAIRAERLRRRLQNARKKLKALTTAENELELQRARMAKTATIGGVTKRGKKIKIRERKR